MVTAGLRRSQADSRGEMKSSGDNAAGDECGGRLRRRRNTNDALAISGRSKACVRMQNSGQSLYLIVLACQAIFLLFFALVSGSNSTFSPSPTAKRHRPSTAFFHSHILSTGTPRFSSFLASSHRGHALRNRGHHHAVNWASCASNTIYMGWLLRPISAHSAPTQRQ